jgi:PLP dependent protein
MIKSIDKREVIENLEKINCPPQVTLIAVSKRKPAAMIKAAYQAGVRNFGENYLQDALPKIEILTDLSEIRWHFIGHIQSNKIKPIVQHFHMIQSVDRKKIIRKIAKEGDRLNKVVEILIQVNIGQEDQKSGIAPKELEEMLIYCQQFPPLRVMGLMAIPPAGQNPAPFFDAMRQLFIQFKETYGLMHLSMGMSADYEQAIAHGSTMVRIGTAIFGPRE